MNKLTLWMKREGITQKQLAAKLGLTNQAVSAWVTGKAYPTGGYALAIEKMSKGEVPWTSLVSKHKRGHR